MMASTAAADAYAGAPLEILAYALQARTLPGAHHAVRIEVPGNVVEVLDPAELPGWDVQGTPEAVEFGDQWLAEVHSAVLIVPAMPSRPVGRVVMIVTEMPVLCL